MIIQMKRMKRILNFCLFCIGIFIFQSCTVNNVTVDDSIGEIFESHQLKGSFGMFDNSRGEFTIYDLERFKSNQIPGQSFHIFSSLVALHTGKLNTTASLIKGNDSSMMSLQDAFRSNDEDHLNAMVQLVGRDVIKQWMDTVKYGNRKVGKEGELFWSNDTLNISPDEQLGLIKRLYFKQHPFRASMQEAVKKMMVVENNASYQLAYQISSVARSQKVYGWVIGWIEENRHVYPFVVHFDGQAGLDVKAKGESLTKDILTHIGFFKGIM